MSTKLSVNINKFALIRNSRDTDMPNIIEMAKKIIAYGGQGITVHPRPDQRHIRYNDIAPLKALCATYKDIEFNIEGFPSEDFIDLVLQNSPDQVTLVPDPPEALTSSFGWDIQEQQDFLTEVTRRFHDKNIRVSLFLDPSCKDLSPLTKIGAERAELYTFDFAHNFKENPAAAVNPYIPLVEGLRALNIGINAGHDLNLDNLGYFLKTFPDILEVSIGHALVCDALAFGLKETLGHYLKASYNS